MFWDYYDDEICYTLEDQYMYGEDLLFAPIYKQGETSREVYLPKGTWVNVLTNETFSGNQTITCHAKIDEFIAFAKAGSNVISCFR